MVQALAAQASPQNTRLPRRTPRSRSTVHTQLAQAHLTRRERLVGPFVFALFFIDPPSRHLFQYKRGVAKRQLRALTHAAAAPW
jgi:hypothetical protein